MGKQWKQSQTFFFCSKITTDVDFSHEIRRLWRALESPLDCKEIQPVHPQGNQSWIFIGRTDAEAETPVLLATWCEELTHWKRPWCWERMKAGREVSTEDERVGWHHQLNGHEFEQASGVGKGQGSLVWCSPGGCKDLDTSEWLNWLKWSMVHMNRNTTAYY